MYLWCWCVKGHLHWVKMHLLACGVLHSSTVQQVQHSWPHWKCFDSINYQKTDIVKHKLLWSCQILEENEHKTIMISQLTFQWWSLMLWIKLVSQPCWFWGPWGNTWYIFTTRCRGLLWVFWHSQQQWVVLFCSPVNYILGCYMSNIRGSKTWHIAPLMYRIWLHCLYPRLCFHVDMLLNG